LNSKKKIVNIDSKFYLFKKRYYIQSKYGIFIFIINYQILKYDFLKEILKFTEINNCNLLLLSKIWNKSKLSWIWLFLIIKISISRNSYNQTVIYLVLAILVE
jgi:hypothetical protein